MKKNKFQKNRNQKATPRFFAKVNDLKKAQVVLVNLFEGEAFVNACKQRGMSVKVGKRYGEDKLIIINND